MASLANQATGGKVLGIPGVIVAGAMTDGAAIEALSVFAPTGGASLSFSVGAGMVSGYVGDAVQQNLMLAAGWQSGYSTSQAVYSTLFGGALNGVATYKPKEEFITFYHGGSKDGVESMVAHGIKIRPKKYDFGLGFYTTTDKAQAIEWAQRRFPNNPAVVEFRVPRSSLEGLNTLDMGAATQSSLFRFFRHNRLGGKVHSYDVVSGPMLLKPKSFLQGAPGNVEGQQTSWHTQRATELLWYYVFP